MSRSVVIPVRVSAEMAARIDQARGAASRSRFAETAISAWLHTAEITNTAAEGWAALAGPDGQPGPCPHPAARVIKGFCYACGRPVP